MYTYKLNSINDDEIAVDEEKYFNFYNCFVIPNGKTYAILNNNPGSASQVYNPNMLDVSNILACDKTNNNNKAYIASQMIQSNYRVLGYIITNNSGSDATVYVSEILFQR